MRARLEATSPPSKTGSGALTTDYMIVRMASGALGGFLSTIIEANCPARIKASDTFTELGCIHLMDMPMGDPIIRNTGMSMKTVESVPT